jgi:hypothetical protein
MGCTDKKGRMKLDKSKLYKVKGWNERTIENREKKNLYKHRKSNEKATVDLSLINSLEFLPSYSHISGAICPRPLLENKQRFPDSSFTASNSSKNHTPSDARKSSGSSWCAPVADGKQYLQLDLRRLYVIYRFTTFGDSSSAKWVKTYKLNYTDDLINWKPVWEKNVIFIFQPNTFYNIFCGKKNDRT